MAEGHSQHGCHGTLHPDHPVCDEVHPSAKAWQNVAAPNTPYFTPWTDPPAGSARNPDTCPLLFKPIKVSGMTMHNRIMVSPMCQYSAEDGHMTMWHWTHLGGIIQRGPGLTMIEATAVVPEGRITPEDLGLWKDSQIGPLAKIVEFAHSQNQKIGVQLAHAGRKASTVAPWVNRKAIAIKEVHGWPDNVVSPSDLPFSDDTCRPRAMTLEEIDQFKKDHEAAVKRALKAGVDTIEVHAAHGYLVNSFLSPASNKRTDKYGGSFENRVRLLVELVQISKAVMPKDMPLFVRGPGTDWLEHDPSLPQWDMPQAVELAKVLEKHGVDFLDVSTGGNDNRQKVKSVPGYQVPFSAAIKKAIPNSKMIVSIVGMIESGKQAEGILEKGEADVIVVARGFQKNPGLVWAWADELDTNIYLADQIGWGFGITHDHVPQAMRNRR